MSSNELIILKELEEVLISDNPNDLDVVSLYDLSKLMNLKYQEYDKLIKRLKKYIEDKYSDIRLNSFDYKKDVLILEIKSKDKSTNQLVAFTKQDDDYIFQSKNNDNILSLIKNDLIVIYDELIKFREFMTNEIYFKKSVNSSFEFTSYNSCIFINYRNDSELLEDFDITYYNKNDYYEHESNSKDISNLITGNEDKIFKKIFVNIKDCPKWSRDILYNYRKMQLNNEKTKNLKIMKCTPLGRH